MQAHRQMHAQAQVQAQMERCQRCRGEQGIVQCCIPPRRAPQTASATLTRTRRLVLPNAQCAVVQMGSGKAAGIDAADGDVQGRMLIMPDGFAAMTSLLFAYVSCSRCSRGAARHQRGGRGRRPRRSSSRRRRRWRRRWRRRRRPSGSTAQLRGAARSSPPPASSARARRRPLGSSATSTLSSSAPPTSPPPLLRGCGFLSDPPRAPPAQLLRRLLRTPKTLVTGDAARAAGVLRPGQGSGQTGGSARGVAGVAAPCRVRGGRACARRQPERAGLGTAIGTPSVYTHTSVKRRTLPALSTVSASSLCRTCPLPGSACPGPAARSGATGSTCRARGRPGGRGRAAPWERGPTRLRFVPARGVACVWNPAHAPRLPPPHLDARRAVEGEGFSFATFRKCCFRQVAVRRSCVFGEAVL